MRFEIKFDILHLNGAPANSVTQGAAQDILGIYAVTVHVAHRKTPPIAPMYVVRESKYVVDGLTKHLPMWERRGWLGVANVVISAMTGV